MWGYFNVEDSVSTHTRCSCMRFAYMMCAHHILSDFCVPFVQQKLETNLTFAHFLEAQAHWLPKTSSTYAVDLLCLGCPVSPSVHPAVGLYPCAVTHNALMHSLCEQTCPNSDISGDSRRRQLLSQHDDSDVGLRSSLLSMTGSRKLLQQKNYPFYPGDAAEALAILAITHRGLQAVFALVHWFINTNQYVVSYCSVHIRLLHQAQSAHEGPQTFITVQSKVRFNWVSLLDLDEFVYVPHAGHEHACLLKASCHPFACHY